MANKALVLLSNQLFHPKRWPAQVRRVQTVYIVRPSEYEDPLHHRQKLCLMHSAIAEYKLLLAKQYRVIEIRRITAYPKTEFYMFEVVDKPMQRYVPTNATVLPTPMFLNSSDMALPKRMYPFYVAQRKQLQLWVKNDKPLFGKWSFDSFNRNRFPSQYSEQAMVTYDSPSIRKAIASVNKLKKAFGELTVSYYPTTHAGATKHLRNFLTTKLSSFGQTQDAISKTVVVGNHANISALLNMGLLTPAQVLEELRSVSVKTKDEYVQVEAFARQIIGWREYMRLVYVNSSGINALTGVKTRRKIPSSWFDATTGIAVLDNTIRKFYQYGYVHHIERLMVLNNALTMMEINIRDVYHWFTIVSVDSYDWVMVPNICMNHNAMNAYVDRRFMSRTYVSSAKYLQKMSDYKPQEIVAFDTLFDLFIRKYADILSKDYQLAGTVKRALMTSNAK